MSSYNSFYHFSRTRKIWDRSVARERIQLRFSEDRSNCSSFEDRKDRAERETVFVTDATAEMIIEEHALNLGVGAGSSWQEEGLDLRINLETAIETTRVKEESLVIGVVQSKLIGRKTQKHDENYDSVNFGIILGECWYRNSEELLICPKKCSWPRLSTTYNGGVEVWTSNI